MRLIREITVAGTKVLVKELTVGEIRAWLASKTEVGDLVDSALFEELALSDLLAMTDLTPEALEAMAPSEIAEVLAVAREVNGRFFAMRERVVALGREILAAQSESLATP